METRTVPPYHLVQLGQLQENFHSEAGKFMHIMANSGGLRNMQMGETLFNLYNMFLRIAALLDASRNINGQVTLDTGRHALAIASSMAQNDETPEAEDDDQQQQDTE